MHNKPHHNEHSKNIVLADFSSHMTRNYLKALSMGKNNEATAYYNGYPTYIINNSYASVLKEIRDLNIDYRSLIFVFDTLEQKTSHRYFLSESYKSNRTPRDKDYILMHDALLEYVSIKGFPVLKLDEYEADDIIASLAKKFGNLGYNVYILSRDKDLFQLVNENTFVYDGVKLKLYDSDEVYSSKGVKPSQMIDFLAMTGDTADSIDGIKSCGDTSAVKILQNYSLDEVINDPDIILSIENLKTKKAISEFIKANPEHVKLSKKLVELVDDIDFGCTLKDFKLREIDSEGAESFKKRFGFFK